MLKPPISIIEAHALPDAFFIGPWTALEHACNEKVQCLPVVLEGIPQREERLQRSEPSGLSIIGRGSAGV